MNQVFRLFVSSTFSDMKNERDLLQRKVFPEVTKFANALGVRFLPVDLRWGISLEAAESRSALKICLDEVAKCLKSTPIGPNFLILLGDRYGWRPLPSLIPQAEFEELLGHLSPDEAGGLRLCFRLDENAYPVSQYRLMPELLEGGEGNERDMRDALFLAIARAGWSGDDPRVEKFTYSVTHREIVRGLQQDKPEQALAYLREAQYPPDFSQREEYCDLKPDGRPDANAGEWLDFLRHTVRASLPEEQVHSYAARVEGNSLTADWEGLSEQITQDLCKLIEGAVKQARAVSSGRGEEAQAHWDFAYDRAHRFTGREDILGQLNAYIQNRSLDQSPLVITGESGMGKSALIAQCAVQAMDVYPETIKIVRFVGATPNSSNLRRFLVDLCNAIEDSAEKEAPEREPDSIAILVNRFHKLLKDAKEDFVIFLDGLDQMEPADGALSLTWIPRRLKENVRIIVSILDRTDDPASIEAIRSIREQFPASQVLTLPPIDRSLGAELLRLWLQESARQLTSEQTSKILDQFEQSGSPLWLKLVAQSVTTLASWEPAPVFPIDTHQVVANFFETLETPYAHGRSTVETSLAYLSGARYGLDEDELGSVMAQDPEYWEPFVSASFHHLAVRKLPPIVWARLADDLGSLLSVRRTHGRQLTVFHHRVIAEVARERYYQSNALRVHSQLGAFFDQQESFHELAPTKRRVPNFRKASELIFQRLHAGQVDEICGSTNNPGPLMDIFFLESKSESGLVYELAADYEAVLGALDQDHPNAGILRLLSEALSRELQFIHKWRVRYPSALFQSLWNVCWWYDAPDVEAYYEKVAEPITTLAEPLYVLMEKWRAQRVEANGGQESWWIRRCNPPALSLGGPIVGKLTGHTWQISSLAISPDGKSACSGGRALWSQSEGSGEILLWDLQEGRLKRRLDHIHACHGVAYFPDGEHIATCGHVKGNSNVGQIRIWNTDSESLVDELETPSKLLRSIAISPDGKWLAVVSDDGKLILTDTAHKKQLRCIEVSPEALRQVKFSLDSRMVACVGWKPPVYCYEVETGNLLREFKGQKVIVFSPGGGLWTASEDDQAIQWELDSGVLGKTLQVDARQAGACSADGRHIALAGIGSESLSLCRLGSGDVLGSLTPHTDGISALAFTPDGETLISASDDRLLLLYDLRRPFANRVVKGHDTAIIDTCFQKDGSRLATAGANDTVILWEMPSCKEVMRMKNSIGTLAGITISPCGNWVAGGGVFSTRVVVWDVETGEPLVKLKVHPNTVTQLAFSPDSKLLACGGDDCTVRIWNWERGEELCRLEGFKQYVTQITFHPDGKTLVVGTGNILDSDAAGELKVWDIPSFAPRWEASTESAVFRIAFTPGGESVFACPVASDVLWTWDLRTGEPVNTGEGLQTCLDQEIYPPPGRNRYVYQAQGETAIVNVEKRWSSIVPSPQKFTIVEGHPYQPLFALTYHPHFGLDVLLQEGTKLVGNT